MKAYEFTSIKQVGKPPASKLAPSDQGSFDLTAHEFRSIRQVGKPPTRKLAPSDQSHSISKLGNKYELRLND